MADAHTGLRGALMQGVEDSPLGLPYAVENSPFTKPTDKSPWASVFVLPNQPLVASLGASGSDAHDGVLQVDLNYPLMTGEQAVMAKADALSAFFKAGKRLAHNGVELTVTSCGRSRGREVDGWYRVSMTVTWEARVPRN